MSKSAREHFSRGSKSYAAGNLQEAAEAFEEALELDPSLTAAAFQLARVRETQGLWTRATQAYDRLLSAEPAHQTALANRGECLRQAGCYHLALLDHGRALELQPDHLFALAGKAETLRMVGRPHEALMWFDSALAVNPEHVFALRGKAATLNALGRYEEALPYWSEALGLDPTSSFSILGRDEANRALANGDLPTDLVDVPLPTGVQLQARNAYDWGRALIQETRYPPAVEAFQTALEHRPTWVDAALELAIAFEADSRWPDALRAYDRVLEMEPTRVDAANNQGDVLRKAERFEEAIRAYDRALQLKPDHVAALAGRAEALRYLSRYEAALTWYDRALERRPAYPFALRGKAATLNAVERHTEALPLWERALGLDPDSEFTRLGLARTREAVAESPGSLVAWKGHQLPGRGSLSHASALLRQGRHREAIDLLADVTETDSTWAEPHYLLGLAFTELREHTAAITHFERVLELDADHLEAALARANAMRKNNDYREAIDAYDRILDLRPDDLRALTHRGECSRMLGDFTGALAWFERALEVRPNHNFALCGKAACLNALGRFREAEPIWSAAMQENSKSPFIRRGLASCRAALGRPDSPTLLPSQPTHTSLAPGARSRAQQAVEQGRSHYKAKEYTQAIHAFKRALSLDPAFTEAALRLGMALEDHQSYGEAIEAYERCLELDDQHFQAAANIGESLRKAERYNDALKAYDRALAINPTYLYALAGRAECMRMLKDHEGALEWFDRALAENPKHSFAIQGKAAALNTLKRFDEAKPLWEKALEIEPNTKFAITGLRKCEEGLKESPEQEAEPTVLDEQGRDLTALARAGELAPVIGRKAEIRSVMRTLVRRLKANPLLLGEPGVGKTAVVEGVAARIAAGDVPERLKNVRIIEVSMGAMVAGTKYRGSFEERLRAILKECRDDPNIVLFIDEIHTLVGAGRTEVGSLDAANILKPALARGELTCIGATTEAEYAKYFEPDSALDRRFHPIHIDEPSPESTVELLTAMAPSYERHHHVTIDPAALQACVDASVRYVPERRLPDKAMDVLDEACAEASLAGRTEVTAHTVAAVMSEHTGIPIADLGEAERSRLGSVEGTLADRVIGQSEAVKQVADAVRMARSGLKDPKRPRGVFLFVGGSGVGKTELAKALANFLFPEGDALIRVDMSEFSEKHTSSRLMGAPPGYLGSGEEGQLTGPLRRRPYSVVLLDEFEKAHPEVQSTFLSLFDEGRLTDAQGRGVNARETFFVLTTNAGSELAGRSRLGFGGTSAKERRALAKERLADHFRPELLNRLDDTVIFDELTHDDLVRIAHLKLTDLASRAARQQTRLTWTDEVAELCARRQADPKFGARPVVRAVDELLTEPLGKMLVSGRSVPKVRARVERGEVVLQVELDHSVDDSSQKPSVPAALMQSS